MFVGKLVLSGTLSLNSVQLCDDFFRSLVLSALLILMKSQLNCTTGPLPSWYTNLNCKIGSASKGTVFLTKGNEVPCQMYWNIWYLFGSVYCLTWEPDEQIVFWFALVVLDFDSLSARHLMRWIQSNHRRALCISTSLYITVLQKLWVAIFGETPPMNPSLFISTGGPAIYVKMCSLQCTWMKNICSNTVGWPSLKCSENVLHW